MHLARSLLFVPGDRPDRFDKATASGAHQVILDLEDAVTPDAKATARMAIADWDGRGQAMIRINGSDSPWFADDLALVRDLRVTKVMIPKAEPDAVRAVGDALGDGVEFCCLIETVVGLMEIRDICRHPQVTRLAFGHLDFSLDAGVAETDRQLDSVRLQITLESRYAGLAAPVDGVFADFSDGQGLTTQVRHVRTLGFGGKLCIHPKQVATVNDGFLPTGEEVQWARRIMQAIEVGGDGAISVDGKMVDRPVAERARAILRADGDDF